MISATVTHDGVRDDTAHAVAALVPADGSPAAGTRIVPSAATLGAVS